MVSRFIVVQCDARDHPGLWTLGAIEDYHQPEKPRSLGLPDYCAFAVDAAHFESVRAALRRRLFGTGKDEDQKIGTAHGVVKEILDELRIKHLSIEGDVPALRPANNVVRLRERRRQAQPASLRLSVAAL